MNLLKNGESVRTCYGDVFVVAEDQTKPGWVILREPVDNLNTCMRVDSLTKVDES